MPSASTKSHSEQCIRRQNDLAQSIDETLLAIPR